MNEVCTCMAHDSFDTAYIGKDQHLHCQLCKKVLPGWESLTVGTIEDEPDVVLASMEDMPPF